MRIYTRTGDDGTTGLVGGQRTRKSDPRLECMGTLDELNAALGLAAANAAPQLLAQLHEIQNDLFTIGAHLASPAVSASLADLPPLNDQPLKRLESQIDAAEATLPPLTQFILPSGTELAARLHLARAICRRAERLLVAFALRDPTPPAILPYLNRLSDWLFMMARLANHHAHHPDRPWQKPIV
ncbi:MAG TPA: cob(I)yrinic acid a,c-diamide adenosyltransferase [Tepidisphaeraceae bacterium]|nr:cob(I)yrinic acid a,c-diamide adenosyltransferase [Tepidisphaeraceae bacterium]